MRPEFQRGFDAVEQQRSAIQSSVLVLSDAQLKWSPDGATWSIRGVIEHLVLSDETVGRARDTGEVEAEALMFRILPRALRRALILSALKHDRVLPLPSPDVEPRGDVPLSELLERWTTARDEMRRTLDALQGDERRYAHPVLGPLTPTQMLELGQTHTAYHMRQIDSVRGASAFPRGAEAEKV